MLSNPQKNSLKKFRHNSVLGITFNMILSVVTPLIFLHIILISNRTYSIGDGLSSEQFELVLKNVSSDNALSIGIGTGIKYFNYFPDWTPNIFYLLYFIAIVITIIGVNQKAFKFVNLRSIKVVPSLRKNETKAEFVTRFVQWKKDNGLMDF